jgi:hypothetical protein
MPLVYLPDSVPGPDATTLAALPASLSGVRVAVLDNGKPNAGVVMVRAAETLAARTGAKVCLVTKKGPQGLSANAATPVARDILDRLVAEADVVITGTADCGSCTAYSVQDARELDQAGTPAIVMTTTKFEPVADHCGLPGARKLVLPHPIGGTDEATLHAWGDAAADRLISLLTPDA